MRLDNVLMEILDIPAHEVKQLVVQLRNERGLYPPAKNPIHRSGKIVLPSGLGDLQSIHRYYLERRGFDPDLLYKLWGVRGIGLAKRLAWRIFIPVVVQGDIVTWTTRAVRNGPGPRYLSAQPDEEKIPLKETLLGEDYCRNTIVVTEGPFDAMRIGPGAVCTFGVGLSTAQTNLLCKYSTCVVCFDNENSAQRRANRLVEILGHGSCEIYNVVLSSGKDPASATQREIDSLRRTFLNF